MPRYYFHDKTDNKGKHEVHNSECSYLPSILNRTEIGYCSDCHEALKTAKTNNPYKSFDGCYYCSYPCHTG